MSSVGFVTFLANAVLHIVKFLVFLIFILCVFYLTIYWNSNSGNKNITEVLNLMASYQTKLMCKVFYATLCVCVFSVQTDFSASRAVGKGKKNEGMEDIHWKEGEKRISSHSNFYQYIADF